MSYLGISIKEALERINTTWFLPAVQRPYVWGNRYESEKYICRLFDSLFQMYPIGGLIMWETDSKVAHREFIRDYHQGDTNHLVEEGIWDRHKCLVYDGQQRLQTLFCCLKYTFNDRILVFDLSYDQSKDEDLDTGFSFIDKNTEVEPFQIKMNRLFALPSDSDKKPSIRREFTSKTDEEEIQNRIEQNLDRLWGVFVGRDSKSLAYFSIASSDEKKVNDIFERLNTGGIPLSKADLLFSRIKAEYPEYEYDIMAFCKQLTSRTKIAFESYDVLQVLHMIVKGRSRVDENANSLEIQKFKFSWDKLQIPLNVIFDDYLVGHFNITNMAIIRNKMPLLVLIVFFYRYYEAGKKFREISAENLKKIDRFFITAEINDWALQSYTDNFTKVILSNGEPTIFPLEQIEEYVARRGNRPLNITEAMFRGYRWMALKFIVPNRAFDFEVNMENRFNPELDHIFPIRLKEQDEKYRQTVDVVWNMQPVKGEINNLKLNFHPLAFFTDKAQRKDGTVIQGSKYFVDYDFVPNLSDAAWNNYEVFIDERRKQMVKFMKDRYGVELVPDIPVQ